MANFIKGFILSILNLLIIYIVAVIIFKGSGLLGIVLSLLVLGCSSYFYYFIGIKCGKMISLVSFLILAFLLASIVFKDGTNINFDSEQSLYVYTLIVFVCSFLFSFMIYFIKKLFMPKKKTIVKKGTFEDFLRVNASAIGKKGKNLTDEEIENLNIVSNFMEGEKTRASEQKGFSYEGLVLNDYRERGYTVLSDIKLDEEYKIDLVALKGNRLEIIQCKDWNGQHSFKIDFDIVKNILAKNLEGIDYIYEQYLKKDVSYSIIVRFVYSDDDSIIEREVLSVFDYFRSKYQNLSFSYTKMNFD